MKSDISRPGLLGQKVTDSDQAGTLKVTNSGLHKIGDIEKSPPFNLLDPPKVTVSDPDGLLFGDVFRPADSVGLTRNIHVTG